MINNMDRLIGYEEIEDLKTITITDSSKVIDFIDLFNIVFDNIFFIRILYNMKLTPEYYLLITTGVVNGLQVLIVKRCCDYNHYIIIYCNDKYNIRPILMKSISSTLTIHIDNYISYINNMSTLIEEIVNLDNSHND